MTMTADGFLAALAVDVSEVLEVVREHLRDNDELLLHLLTADLRRYALEAFKSGESDVVRRLLDVIDLALVEGNEDLNNLVAVSFAEDTGWWDPAMRHFIASWPQGMQAEVRSQREGPT